MSTHNPANFWPNQAERQVLAAARAGMPAELGRADTDPSAWPSLRAAFLRILLLRLRADWPLHPTGLRLTRAIIDGDLDLAGASDPDADGHTAVAPAEFTVCTFTRVNLRHARLARWHMVGCELSDLDATGARFDAGMRLDTSRVTESGTIRLDGAVIEGALSADGLEGCSRVSAVHARINGDVGLRRAFSDTARTALPGTWPTIVFTGADIFGDAELEGLHAGAFTWDKVTLRGSLALHNAELHGEVRLIGATIGGQLTCNGARIENPGNDALSVDQARIRGGLFLRTTATTDGTTRRFTAFGAIRLLGATIGGQLSCEGARLNNPDGNALSAEHAEIKDSVFLRQDFTARGMVRLIGTTIGGDLSCDGAVLDNPGPAPGQAALHAERADIKGSVFLRQGFTTRGKVRLIGATIGGQLACEGARLHNPHGDALEAFQANIVGGASVKASTTVVGRVDFRRAQVGHDFYCAAVTLRGPLDGPYSGLALAAREMQVAGSVYLVGDSRDGPFRAWGRLNLSAARIEGAVACAGAWLRATPKPGLTAALDLSHARIRGELRFAPLTDVDQALDAAAGDTLPSVIIGAVKLDSARVESGVRLTGAAFRVIDEGPQDGEAGDIARAGAQDERQGVDRESDAATGICLDARNAVIAGRLDSRWFRRVPATDHRAFETIERQAEERRAALVRWEGEARGAEDKSWRKDCAEDLNALRECQWRTTFRCISEPGSRSPDGVFDLRGAHVGHLYDHPLNGWPYAEGLLRLDGLTYDRVRVAEMNEPILEIEEGDKPVCSLPIGPDARENGVTCWSPSRHSRRLERARADPENLFRRRIIWLGRQWPGATPSPKDFLPQPFEQLSKVLRVMGHDDDAGRVAVAKRRLYLDSRGQSRWHSIDRHCEGEGKWLRLQRDLRADRLLRRVGLRLLDSTSKFGYSPKHALASLVIALAAGLALATVTGALDGFTQPSILTAIAGDAHTGHCALNLNGETSVGVFGYLGALVVYVLDVFVPLVELGDLASGTSCVPRHGFMGLLMGAYRVVGWALVSIFLLTITGVMRRD